MLMSIALGGAAACYIGALRRSIEKQAGGAGRRHDADAVGVRPRTT